MPDSSSSSSSASSSSESESSSSSLSEATTSDEEKKERERKKKEKKEKKKKKKEEKKEKKRLKKEKKKEKKLEKEGGKEEAKKEDTEKDEAEREKAEKEAAEKAKERAAQLEKEEKERLEKLKEIKEKAREATKKQLEEQEKGRKKKLIGKLSDWKLAKSSVMDDLPIDPKEENTAREVTKAIFSKCEPTGIKDPKLVLSSESALELLDWNSKIVNDTDFIDIISGNKTIKDSVPLAHRYGGHQNGTWVAQLGDGRAHLLGEYINSKDERWELQLKGSGKTPYSKEEDGRTVLRSSIREFLCSEAMHYLGVPTTRSAALVVSKDTVSRDQFADGKSQDERVAVLLRLSPSWFRFGSFEALNNELDEYKQLLKYVVKVNFPYLHEILPGDSAVDCENRSVAMFSEVADRTAYLLAKWMSVGFAHGHANSDNMSILSLTLDYGPFGFLGQYEPKFVPNSSDKEGRYDFKGQPAIGFWNLHKFALSINRVIAPEKHRYIAGSLERYGKLYGKYFLLLFRTKFGLTSHEDDNDMKIFAFFFNIMERNKADFTQVFRELSQITWRDLFGKKIPKSSWGLNKLKDDNTFWAFVKLYAARFQKDTIKTDEARMALMQKTNPRYVLRNWMVQSAIKKAEEDDFSEVKLLMEVVRRPFDLNEKAEDAGYSKAPPDSAKNIKVSVSS